MTTTAAEAPFIATKHLYDSNPTILVTSLVEDDSDVSFKDITARLQIVSGEHAVVLDFSTYHDVAADRGSIVEELEAVERLYQSVKEFRSRFQTAVRNSMDDQDFTRNA